VLGKRQLWATYVVGEDAVAALDSYLDLTTWTSTLSARGLTNSANVIGEIHRICYMGPLIVFVGEGGPGDGWYWVFRESNDGRIISIDSRLPGTGREVGNFMGVLNHTPRLRRWLR
jgi:hypothetical protein